MNVRGSGVLLTGATGFVGGEVLARLIARGQGPVYALIRGRDDAEAAARLQGVTGSLFGDGDPLPGQVHAVAGDITQPGLGMSEEKRAWVAERVDRVIHCAASVSFGLGLEESRAINVEGTRRVLDLAGECERRGGLDHLVHVSTAYVSGDFRGGFGEDDLVRGQRFRNPYEQSKYEAELLVRERGGSLPVQVARPSIVVGDSRTGWTPAFNVLYGPLRAFSLGLMGVLPARASAPVDVVPVDYVADGILALAGRPGTTANLTAGPAASSVGELLELACAYTGRPAPRLLPPPLYRRAVHPLLLRGADERRARGLRRSEALFPYFAMRVRFDNRRCAAALSEHGITAPPLASYFERLMDFAESANWGRSLPARHAAASATAGQRRRRHAGEPAPAMVAA